MKELFKQSHKILETTYDNYDLAESTAEYAKSLEKIANDRKMKNISKKDKETLIKIAQLMKTANEEKEEVTEKLKPGKIDGRTLAGKIITGEVKLLTAKQGSPGRRGTYIMATGEPSVMGAPPDSMYIDSYGGKPKNSGTAMGFGIDQIKKAEILNDGSARVELK